MQFQIGESIREITDAYLSGKALSGVMYGTVRSVSPLVIDVNSKLRLSAAFLSVARHLTDYEIPFEAQAHIDAPDENGRCTLSEGVILLKNALAPGERVLLARLEGGQQYAVIDRV